MFLGASTPTTCFLVSCALPLNVSVIMVIVQLAGDFGYIPLVLLVPLLADGPLDFVG